MSKVKYFIACAAVAAAVSTMSGCTLFESAMKDFESDTKGIDRVVTLYDYEGEQIAEWEGNMRLETATPGEVSFIIDGKRTVIEGGIAVIQEI